MPLRRLPACLSLAGALLLPGCGALWPERLAVNAPLGHLLFGRGIAPPSAEETAGRLRAPEGLTVGHYAADLQGVRFLRFTPSGDLLASQPRVGRVVLLAPDRNGDGRSDGVRVLLEGLNRPHGIDLQPGWLYVAETDAVGRVRFDAETGTTSGSFERVVTGLPAGGNHWTRTVRFGPDGAMYVSVGSSCNACREDDVRRASLLRFDPDGGGGRIFASGLRNTVGFDWQPGTGRLFGTDNGRDLLGDDMPPCELNEIREGAFYGWPFAHGDRMPDPDLGAGHEEAIARSRPPVHAFRAHVAPLGITFVRSPEAPEAIRGAALVALHGSWNRTRKDGYEVVSLHFGEDGRVEERPFLTGFLRDENVIGRPVDVAEGTDGAIYVSDDYAGTIYRVAAGPVAAATTPPERTTSGGAAAEDAGDVARGRALFDGHGCAGCHVAERALAGVVVRPLAGLSHRYGATDLAAFLATPTPPMPVAPLSDADRRDLSAFLLARFP